MVSKCIILCIYNVLSHAPVLCVFRQREIQVFLFISAMAVDKANFLLPNNQRFVELDSSQAFNNLTKDEKLYAHYLSQVSH